MSDRLQDRNMECTSVICKPLPKIIGDAIKNEILEKSKSLSDLKDFQLREKMYTK